MACGGFMCSRNMLILLNIMYFVVALMLIGLAGYAKVMAIITTIPVMSGIIACGVFLALIAVVGLAGAVRHHQVLLFFYMIILFLIFLVQFSVACASLALSDMQQKELFRVGWKAASSGLRETTQEIFQCCGMDQEHQNFTTTNSTSSAYPYFHPPCSKIKYCVRSPLHLCCGATEPANSTTTFYECPAPNCWQEIEGQLRQMIRAVGLFGLFFSFTEIIGIWMAFRYRNQKDPRANPSAFL